MTPQEYIALRLSEGKNTTAAVAELSQLCCVTERSVWGWIKSKPVPAYATRLLTIWKASTAAQREAWFTSPQPQE